MKLTLKSSSFLFVNKVSLVKNVTVDVDPSTLLDKDKIVLNSYINSGAVTSDGGLFQIDVLVPEVVNDEAPVEVVTPVEEPVIVEAPTEVVETDVTETVEVEEAPKKKTTRKTAAKK